MRLLSPVLVAALLAAGPAWAYEPTAEGVRAHMGVLAADAMEGRAAGTPGYDRAADYVADQYRRLGLKPAGDAGSHLQSVPLVSYAPANEGSLVVTGADGRRTPLVFGVDHVPGASPLEARTTVSAPLVFVGYGVVAPERGRDDYAGLDVRGKIVVALSGAPSGFQTEERAHYAGTKREAAARRGAIGLITVNTPAREKQRPFAETAKHWREPRMTWRRPDGVPDFDAAGVKALGTVSVAGAAKLFAGAPYSLDAVYAAAATPEGTVPRFALGSAAADHASAIQDVRSANVLGVVEGSDPRLKNEYVVLTAHLDHVGVDPTAEGDGLHNGAMDNAAGVATLLEVARAFQGGAKPKRSVLFAAVTAEERGLVGADYLAQNPPAPKAAMVANVNLDMPVLTYPFTDVIAFGADRSTMGPIIAEAAARRGIKLIPDPMPEQGLFTRSDHYRFVEQGIPSVFLMTGFGAGGDKAFPAFLATHYHKPSDDLSLPIDYGSGARFAAVNYEIARALADAAERPRWKEGDFFGRTFGGAR